MNIKPVIITSRGACVFVDKDGRMEVVVDQNQSRDRINMLLVELKNEIGTGVTNFMLGAPRITKLFLKKRKPMMLSCYVFLALHRLMNCSIVKNQ